MSGLTNLLLIFPISFESFVSVRAVRVGGDPTNPKEPCPLLFLGRRILCFRAVCWHKLARFYWHKLGEQSEAAAKRFRILLQQRLLNAEFDFGNNASPSVQQLLPENLLESIPKWKWKRLVWGEKGHFRNATLHLACCTLQLPLIQLLLETGVPLSGLDRRGHTPLAAMLLYHKGWVEPNMEDIFRLFIDAGFLLSADRSLNFPLVHFVVFADKVDILDYALRRFSYVPCKEDGLLPWAIEAGVENTLLYLLQNFPLSLVGNPFALFQFATLPTDTRWIAPKHAHMYRMSAQSLLRSAMHTSLRSVKHIIGEAVMRFQQFISDRSCFAQEPLNCPPNREQSPQSSYLPTEDRVRLLKFFMDMKFLDAREDSSVAESVHLREVLESAAAIDADTVLDPAFWFAHTAPSLGVNRENLCANDTYEESEQGEGEENADSTRIDLFSAWQFIDRPELLDVVFEFCLAHDVDLVAVEEPLAVGCPENADTLKGDPSRMRDIHLPWADHLQFMTGMQFAAMFFQNAALFARLLDKYSSISDQNEEDYLSRVTDSPSFLLHCAVIANNELTAQILLARFGALILTEVMSFHSACPEQRAEQDLMWTRLGGERACSYPIGNLRRFAEEHRVTEATPVAFALMIVAYADSAGPAELCGATRCCAILERLLEHAEAAFHSLERQHLTLLDFFVHFENSADAHLRDASPFNILLQSAAFQDALAHLHEDAYVARILHTLLENVEHFGSGCMWTFMEALVKAGISLNVVLDSRISFHFLTILGMFAPLQLFRLVVAPIIADTPQQAESSTNRGCMRNKADDQHWQRAVFLLGCALNAAVAAHNNSVVEYLFAQMSCAGVDAFSNEIPFGRAAYESPFRLLKEFYARFAASGCGRARDFALELDAAGCVHVPHLTATARKLEDIAASASVHIFLGHLERCDLELPANDVERCSIDASRIARGTPLAGGEIQYAVCTPLAVACATYNTSAIARFASQPEPNNNLRLAVRFHFFRFLLVYPNASTHCCSWSYLRAGGGAEGLRY